LFKGRDLTKLSEQQMRAIRGSNLAMIFQDPMTALNPTLTIGTQLMEGLRQHHNVTRDEAKQRALAMLDLVGITNPEERLRQYPHQFSGGMRQRIVIAISLFFVSLLLNAVAPSNYLSVTS